MKQDKPKLESFAYKAKALEAMATGTPFFMDSGAFTIATTGVHLSLLEYSAFLKLHKQQITIAASFDDVTKHPEISYSNQKKLEDLGVDTIPVFHTREPVEWLERYIKEGYTYIALGGMVPERKQWLQKWLDHLFGDVLTCKEGVPLVKIHGLGMTQLDLLARYPWYSVDSSSWCYGSRFACGLIRYADGRFRWTYFSRRHGSAKNFSAMSYYTFTDAERAQVDSFLFKQGYTAAQFEKDLFMLDVMNAKVITQHNIFADRFRARSEQGLFDA